MKRDEAVDVLHKLVSEQHEAMFVKARIMAQDLQQALGELYEMNGALLALPDRAFTPLPWNELMGLLTKWLDDTPEPNGVLKIEWEVDFD